MSKRLTAWDTKVKPRLTDIEYWAQMDTDAIIAERLGISTRLYYMYKEKHPELAEAIQRGHEKASRNLRKSLFTLACGYEETETVEKMVVDDGAGTITTKIRKTKTVAPSLKAIICLLEDYDREFHADRDGYELKKEALKIQKDKTTHEENGWEV